MIEYRELRPRAGEGIGVSSVQAPNRRARTSTTSHRSWKEEVVGLISRAPADGALTVVVGPKGTCKQKWRGSKRVSRAVVLARANTLQVRRPCNRSSDKRHSDSSEQNGQVHDVTRHLTSQVGKGDQRASHLRRQSTSTRGSTAPRQLRSAGSSTPCKPYPSHCCRLFLAAAAQQAHWREP